MPHYEHLPICREAFKFQIYCETIIQHFSRYLKYSHGSGLRDTARTVIKLILRADNQSEKLCRGYEQAGRRKVMGINPSHFICYGETVLMEEVSWENVQEFIRKLNEMEDTDRNFMLTEAEWEFAAYAVTTTALYNGSITILGANNSPALDSIA